MVIKMYSPFLDDYFELVDFLRILSGLMGLFAGFFAGFGTVAATHTAGKKTVLWGYPLPPIPAVSRARALCGVGWGSVVATMGIMFWAVMLEMDSWDFSAATLLIPIISLLIPIFPGCKVGEKWVNKTLSSANNALSLGSLPIIREVDSRIPYTKVAAVCADGISLYDAKDFCFFTAPYRNYGLGDLKEDQMILLGYYFRQKYSSVFNCKANTQGVYMNSAIATNTAPGVQRITENDQLVGINITSILFVRKA